MEQQKRAFIEKTISKMTLSQKVGQCFVIGHSGNIITPEILERIRKYTPAGLRIGLMWRMKTAKHDPGGTIAEFSHRVIRPFRGTMKDFIGDVPMMYSTNEEFCEMLNTFKKEALNNEVGLPVHITYDMEGDVSADYYFDHTRFFPACMGLTHTDNPQNAYDAAWATCRQLSPLGFNWIHSPVLDVNNNPMNPEIGIRSYGEDSDTVTKYALEALRGFQDAGTIATAKHFPGRGPSAEDAHHGLPSVGLSREEMEEHLKPYRALIAAGLPAIMTAHTAYPALDESGRAATVSKKIITDLLKEEMGFKGVVTTDAISMGGIIQKYDVWEACMEALNAGCDLILMRDEGAMIHDVIPAVIKAAEKGLISEERLNDAISRTLSVKYDYGFFEKPQILDTKKAGEGVHDPRVAKIADTTAQQSLHLMRDRKGILPLSKDKNILLVNQINPLHLRVNTTYLHPESFWLECLKYSDKVAVVETETGFTEQDRQRVKERISDDTDVIVITNYYDRRKPVSGNEFIKELLAYGKPVVVVTNSPYPFTVQEEFDTVIVTYSSSKESLVATAKMIFTGSAK